MHTFIETYLFGFTFFLGLLLPIGPVTIAMLQYGRSKETRFSALLTFLLCDAMLISLSTTSSYTAEVAQGLTHFLKWAAIIFLSWLILISLKPVGSDSIGSLTTAAEPSSKSPTAAMKRIFLLCLLNPHVYLDTVILVGGTSLHYPSSLRPIFAGGALTASLTWALCTTFIGSKLKFLPIRFLNSASTVSLTLTVIYLMI